MYIKYTHNKVNTLLIINNKEKKIIKGEEKKKL